MMFHTVLEQSSTRLWEWQQENAKRIERGLPPFNNASTGSAREAFLMLRSFRALFPYDETVQKTWNRFKKLSDILG